jgi:dTDP-4-dehydrorhamnose 3,5-epimerase-like enzyme
MGLQDVRWIDFQDVMDERGRLTAIEGFNHIPFEIARIFYVHHVQPGSERGGHAHRETDQVIVGVHGTLYLEVSDGTTTKQFILDDPRRGVLIPRMVWVRMYNFSPGAVCLVLASTKYNRSKSIRTWNEYLNIQGLSSLKK